jgi:hypothetical protein
MIKAKTYSSISDRVQHKRDQTIYIDSTTKPVSKPYISYTMKQSLHMGYSVCNCPFYISNNL